MNKNILFWLGSILSLIILSGLLWDGLQRIGIFESTFQIFSSEIINENWQFIFPAFGLSLIALIGVVYLAAGKRAQLSRVQETLRVFEKKWQALSENSPEVIAEFDLTGEILFTNRSMPGHEEKNIGGKNLFDYIPADQHPLFQDALTKTQQAQEPVVFETQVASLRGDSTWSNRLIPVFSLNKLDRLLLISTNITERKRMEHTMNQARHLLENKVIENAAALNVSNEELKKEIEIHQNEEENLKGQIHDLERNQKGINDFISIVSHDLQEPLRKIISLSNRLQPILPKLDQRERETIQRMKSSANRMQAYIDALLKFSRISIQSQTLRATDLKQVVREAVQSLENLVTQTKASVTVDQLPTLRAEPLQMRQLFQNLISNSLKFRRREVPPVIKLTSRKTDKGHWEISVEDNGIGFDQKLSPRIFKPFERLNGRSAYDGSGMGLAICEKIVTRHHGKIMVKSQPQKGATFTVILPEN